MPPIDLHPCEKRLIYIWLAITAGSIIALFLQIIMLIMLISIIGIPLAILLNIMPGFWIYLTPTLAIYLALRSFFPSNLRPVLLGFSALLPLAFGFFIPLWANFAMERQVQTLVAKDNGSPPFLPSGLSITHAWRDSSSIDDRCSDICQRLLLSRMAKTFAEIPIEMLPAQASLPTPVRRYWLGPIGRDCDNGRLPAWSPSYEQRGRKILPPSAMLAEQGLCLHDENVRDTRSDILVVERRTYGANPFWGKNWLLALQYISSFERREVFQSTQGGMKRLMRRTTVRYGQLAKPLWLIPGFTFDTTTPTSWNWDGVKDAGSPIQTVRQNQWTGVLANDLTVDGLP